MCVCVCVCVVFESVPVSIFAFVLPLTPHDFAAHVAQRASRIRLLTVSRGISAVHSQNYRRKSLSRWASLGARWECWGYRAAAIRRYKLDVNKVDI